MRYSLFSGGKRVRPILALAAGEAVGGEARRTLPFACALEMVHAYSLIHDDLPAMDDDDLRRGEPTNHIVFGEGIAILTGDALLTEAFRVMAEAVLRMPNQQERGIKALREVAGAAGAVGMIAGQVADLEAEHKRPTRSLLEYIHLRKTADLIRAAVRAGALVGGATNRQLECLSRYGLAVGLAFQVTDDILDVEGGTAKTGKRQGRDAELHKVTYPAAVGMAKAKARACELLADALAALKGFSPAADPLRQIATFVVERAL
jgi:geranylgeranyl diphosphate synthase type II